MSAISQRSPVPDDERLDPKWRRRWCSTAPPEPPGTIVVQTNERFLYVIQPGGRALRYGIGVGRVGFQWKGLVKITRKMGWPDWTPPDEMIERQPYLPRFMAGGPGNPLGARALYLGSTLYRIHGTNQPQSIGTGLVRMFPSDQSRRVRSLREGPGRHQGDHPAAARSLIGARGSFHGWIFRA